MKRIFFFLGNKPAHMIHGLPLYRELGGECVVLSRAARAFCEAKGLRVAQLDDYPEGFLQLDPRRIGKTIEYLNAQDGVVFFFETYSAINEITSLKKIMLFHGVSLKEWFDDWRIPLINACDYVTTLGPHREEKMRKRGIRPEKFLRIGFTRWDEIIRRAGTTTNQELIFSKLRVRDKKIVTLLTTWYGPTAVNEVGKEIVSRIAGDYVLVFRPHPDTPADVIGEYRSIIRGKPNVLYASENEYRDISLVDLFAVSDLFIGDTSSTIVDAILTDKPILFALDSRRRTTRNPILLVSRAVRRLRHYRKGPFEIHRKHYDPIREVYGSSGKIDMSNVAEINELVGRSLRDGIDPQAWQAAKNRMFYNLQGDNVRRLVEVVEGLFSSENRGFGT